MKDTLLAAVAFFLLTLTLRAIPVGTREAPLGVNGAGLETAPASFRAGSSSGIRLLAATGATLKAAQLTHPTEESESPHTEGGLW